MSTEDDVVSGNMGLKDQSMALRWVHHNAEYFGGDRKRITLIGERAGGSSVHYHYLSPLSAGLFQNGISISGTALNSWALTKNPLKVTKELAKSLECPIKHSLELVECLKNRSVTDIVNATGRSEVKLELLPCLKFEKD